MTKILHQVGHNKNWNLDAYFKNKIGDGFIFTAFSIESNGFSKDISGYKKKDYLPISMIDLQFYGSKESKGGKLGTYNFHPIAISKEDSTQISTKDSRNKMMEGVFKAIDFQEKTGFKKIIIPIIYKEAKGIDDLISIIREINSRLIKKEGFEYFMTIPLSYSLIRDEDSIEKILINVTDLSIKFDGYFVVCETLLKSNEKINTDFVRYDNLYRVFKVLKKEDFRVIYGYSNWDSLVFLSLVELDYISIGTYEVLRNFHIERFTEDKSGGPSDGWYFSEKLLNCIRAREIDNLRRNNALNLIKNEKNIFSDIILEEGYPWNTHKPDVHKNYLLSVSRLLREVSDIRDPSERIRLMLNKIQKANNLYRELEDNRIFLTEASSNYHLPFWESFLKSKIS